MHTYALSEALPLLLGLDSANLLPDWQQDPRFDISAYYSVEDGKIDPESPSGQIRLELEWTNLQGVLSTGKSSKTAQSG